MALKTFKPYTKSTRGTVVVDKSHLWKGSSYKPLTRGQHVTGGRNNAGRITSRHMGGGSKHKFRIIDFFRKKKNVKATVDRIEYDPNRSSRLALLCYADGERRYIVAPRGLDVGTEILTGQVAPIKTGNAMPIKNIPVGTTIHCVELKPGKGAQIARSAGTSVQLLAREGEYAQLRLRSGEVRKVHINCIATIGEVGNDEHSLRKLGKAGAVRWRGVRPTVRGVVMNPVDHPHGGGEGRTSGGRHPVSPWGVPTKGYRTRNNKRTDNMRVSRRPANKR